MANGKGVAPLTVIAPGSRVSGDVEVGGDLRVDGTVDGATLSSAGGCEVAPEGVVQAQVVRAASLVVHGRLTATEVIAETCTVTSRGSLRAERLVAAAVEVEAGGILEAHLESGEAPPEA